MYYEKMTKYKTKVNMTKYKEDIQKIFNALLKEDTKFENYYLYKEDYDMFIDNIIGKIVSLNAPPVIMTEHQSESILLMDKTIFIKPKEKSNSLYYPFLIYKIIDLIIKDNHKKRELLSCIHLQSYETLIDNDKIWLQICKHNDNFVYKPTDKLNIY